MPHVGNVNVAPFTAVGMLRMTFSDGHTYFGSGALINNQWVLTCAHNLIERGGGHSATAVSFHPRWDGGWPAGGGTAADHVFYPAAFVNGAGGQGDRSWDIGLVHLGGVIGGGAPYFTMQLVTDNNLQAQDVTITGYPGNQGGQMWTGTDTVAGINLGHNALAYTHDTDYGSSGSPVYQYAHNVARLYAVHVMHDAHNPDVRLGILLTQAVRNWIDPIVPAPMPIPFSNQV